jgi:hypothetical protein
MGFLNGHPLRKKPVHQRGLCAGTGEQDGDGTDDHEEEHNDEAKYEFQRFFHMDIPEIGFRFYVGRRSTQFHRRCSTTPDRNQVYNHGWERLLEIGCLLLVQGRKAGG